VALAAGTVVPSNPVPMGNHNSYFDTFSVRNGFDGAQIGLTSELHYGPFYLSALATVGLGGLHESAQINGGTVLSTDDGTSTFPGGVLAQQTNSGTHERDRLAFLCEGRIDVGWRPTNWLRVFVGYDFLFLNGVTRVGSLIEGVDSRLVPQLHPTGTTTVATQPAFGWGSSGFWVQGLETGLELRF
jgi:hypothetical protein